MLNSGASRPLAHWFVCYNIYFAAPLLEQRLYGPTVQMCLPDILSRSLTSPSFLFQLFFRRFFHEALSFAVFAFLERGNSTRSARFDNIGLISATILPRIIVSFTVLLRSYSRSREKIGIIWIVIESARYVSFLSFSFLFIPTNN